MFFLQKLWNNADDFYQTKQIEYFFSWLKSIELSKEELVFIDLSLQEGFLECSTRKKVKLIEEDVSFIICKPKSLRVSLLKIDTMGKEESWVLIGSSPRIEIWESKLRHKKFFPLRFGLNETEKLEALKVARNSMEKFLNSDDSNFYTNNFNIRFEQNVTLDVAIWIDGSLRGSIIVENNPLGHAIVKASKLALRDKRFKPVLKEELSKAVVEITLMSDLKVPYSLSDMKDRFLDSCKGYYSSYLEKIGWYLPTVFNCMKFKNSEDFLKSLSYDKAKISTSFSDKIEISTFLVQGFIEYKNSILDLDGPVALLYKDKSGSDLDFKNRILRQCDEAAEWLVSIQDKNGFLPLYSDPIYQRLGNMDWVRLAFTTYALTYYGKSTGNQKFLTAASLSFSYLTKYMEDILHLGVNTSAATLVYMGESALLLGESGLTEEIILNLEKIWENSNYEPILYATAASFFIKYSRNGEKGYLEKASLITEIVWEDFKKKEKHDDPSIEMACYPELINTYHLLSEETKDDMYMQRSMYIANWFKSRQMKNGAFPQSPKSNFCYTRGSGKIFESLAINLKNNREVIFSSFGWLVNMQYSNHNTYFVKEDFKNLIKGGLRHDYANTEAWIDSAGHFIVGGARILSQFSNDE